MSKTDLSTVFRDYIDCLNRQDWKSLAQFVDDEVRYNDQLIGCLVIAISLSMTFVKFPPFTLTFN